MPVRWLVATDFRIDVEVNELLVVRENTFPSLDYQVLRRLALPLAGPS